MAKLKKLRSTVRAFLPKADKALVEFLAEKINQELNENPRTKDNKPYNLNAEIERIIKREEMNELGLR